MSSLFVSDLVFLFQDNEDVKASVLRDAEQAQKLFLQRLFPVEMKDITMTAKSSHKDWLEELASKVEHSKVLASRKEVAKELQQKEIKGSSEELEKLEGQVKHYKSVLDETVSFKNWSTLFENHRKSLILLSELSELSLHFEWMKVH